MKADFYDKYFDELNEEHIIQIANKWSPKDINNYPYKDVITGSLEVLK